MGIFLNTYISHSVTLQEWNEVYEETLPLISKFPLADKRKVTCKGVETVCLVPTKEREEVYGWNKEIKRIGWFTIGDYETMHTAEDYALYRDLNFIIVLLKKNNVKFLWMSLQNLVANGWLNRTGIF